MPPTLPLQLHHPPPPTPRSPAIPATPTCMPPCRPLWPELVREWGQEAGGRGLPSERRTPHTGLSSRNLVSSAPRRRAHRVTVSCGLPLLPLTSSGLLGCSCPHGLSSLPHPGGQCSGPSASPDAFPKDPGLPWGWLPFRPGPVCKLRAVPGEEARSQPQRPGLPGQPASCPLGDRLDMTGTAKQPTCFHKDGGRVAEKRCKLGEIKRFFSPFLTR